MTLFHNAPASVVASDIALISQESVFCHNDLQQNPLADLEILNINAVMDWGNPTASFAEHFEAYFY